MTKTKLALMVIIITLVITIGVINIINKDYTEAGAFGIILFYQLSIFPPLFKVTKN